MDRPLYSNAFSIAYNQKLGEVVLNFDIEYPTFPQVTDSGPVETGLLRDNVCGIVVSKEIAAQLCNIINQTISDAENNE